jgi:hypothetical protein
VWRRDGKELFYLAADNTLTAVPVKTAGSLEAGVPVPLFQIHPFGIHHARHHYAVSQDGQRFLVANLIKETPNTIMLQNWLAPPR